MTADDLIHVLTLSASSRFSFNKLATWDRSTCPLPLSFSLPLLLAPTFACGVLSDTITPRPSPSLESCRTRFVGDRGGSTPLLRSRFTQEVAICKLDRAFEVVFYFRGLNFNPSPTHFLHSGCVPDLPMWCFQQIIPVVAGLALAHNGHPGSSLTRTDIVPKPFPARESSHYSRLRSQHLRRHEGIDRGTMTKL